MIEKDDGYTIVELLVAIVVIGIVVASISTLFININTFQQKTSQIDTATRAAQRKIEMLRNDNYGSLTSGQTINFTNELPDTLPKDKQGIVLVSEPTPDIKRVDVTISFSESGRQEKIVLSSLIGVIGITQ